jgi:hypothetical protein
LLSSLITHMNVIKQEWKLRRYRKRKKREHWCLSCVIYPQILSRTEYKNKIASYSQTDLCQVIESLALDNQRKRNKWFHRSSNNKKRLLFTL